MKYIKLFETTSAYNTYKQSADFVTPNVSLCEDAPTTIYYEPYVAVAHDYSQDYLTFEALESGTFTFTNALSYSLDSGTTWTSLAANTTTPSVAIGDEICFKAELTPDSSNNNGIGTFSATGNFNAKGNTMSLLFGDNFVGQTSLSGKNFAFSALFKDNTKLISAEYLYLPATTLTDHCYDGMFMGCISLTTAPELPAMTLVNSCYSVMFYNCSSLNYIKALFRILPSSMETFSWVDGVAASGTFVMNDEATWYEIGINGIPTGWTVQTYTP